MNDRSQTQPEINLEDVDWSETKRRSKTSQKLRPKSDLDGLNHTSVNYQTPILRSNSEQLVLSEKSGRSYAKKFQSESARNSAKITTAPSSKKGRESMKVREPVVNFGESRENESGHANGKGNEEQGHGMNSKRKRMGRSGIKMETPVASINISLQKSTELTEENSRTNNAENNTGKNTKSEPSSPREETSKKKRLDLDPKQLKLFDLNRLPFFLQ